MIYSLPVFSLLLLPWLVVTMLELVVVGLPALIFCGLLSLYLYFKVKIIFFLNVSPQKPIVQK